MAHFRPPAASSITPFRLIPRQCFHWFQTPGLRLMMQSFLLSNSISIFLTDLLMLQAGIFGFRRLRHVVQINSAC